MVKIRRGRRSRNVEYRAGTGGSRGRLPFPMPASRGGRVGAGAGGAGLIGILVVLAIAVFSGGGGGGGLGGLGGLFEEIGTGQAPGMAEGTAAEPNEFLEVVFDDVQDFWDAQFPAGGYEFSTLVIFTPGGIQTGGCGFATSAVGPFYCPADNTVYIDPEFFEELAGPRFGAAGDFAQAYVVAHEVGHHVQNLTGVSAEVRRLQQAAGSQSEANGWVVRLELQADCLAGMWAGVASRRPPTFEGNDNLLYLERGDLEEGLEAAEVVGDDRIQESAGGEIRPHDWTHGSAAQRQAWFTHGLETGDARECERTFDTSVAATQIMP